MEYSNLRCFRSGCEGAGVLTGVLNLDTALDMRGVEYLPHFQKVSNQVFESASWWEHFMLEERWAQIRSYNGGSSS